MVMEEPSPSPTPDATATEEPDPTPTPEAGAEATAVQEFAIIENYAATRFYPREIVVIKDVPVKLYLTRLHREHVNQFTITPFYSSSRTILPGEVGVIRFVPNRLGVFAIRNVGHDFEATFEATLVLVATVEDQVQRMVDKGVKMFALIHSVDDARVFPDTLLAVKDLPVKVFNISLTEEQTVSVAPFYSAEDVNVKPREITSFDFTPDSAGEFTIQNETYGFTATLVVEDAG